MTTRPVCDCGMMMASNGAYWICGCGKRIYKGTEYRRRWKGRSRAKLTPEQRREVWLKNFGGRND